MHVPHMLCLVIGVPQRVAVAVVVQPSDHEAPTSSGQPVCRLRGCLSAPWYPDAAVVFPSHPAPDRLGRALHAGCCSCGASCMGVVMAGMQCSDLRMLWVLSQSSAADLMQPMHACDMPAPTRTVPNAAHPVLHPQQGCSWCRWHQLCGSVSAPTIQVCSCVRMVLAGLGCACPVADQPHEACAQLAWQKGAWDTAR